MNATRFLAHLRYLVTEAGSQVKLAKKLRVSPAYLCDVLQGRREPGDKILNSLGLKRVVMYRREVVRS